MDVQIDEAVMLKVQDIFIMCLIIL